jgi:hypothetical protein
MTRSFLRDWARGLAGVVLLAQLAISAYACPGVVSSMTANMQMPPTSASPEQRSDSSTVAPMSNCDDMGGTMDSSSPNLCAEHCKYGQQSDYAPTSNVPLAALTALYVTPLVPVTAPPPRPAAATLSALVAASPPHAIVHCVYRI